MGATSTRSPSHPLTSRLRLHPREKEGPRGGGGQRGPRWTKMDYMGEASESRHTRGMRRGDRGQSPSSGGLRRKEGAPSRAPTCIRISCSISFLFSSRRVSGSKLGFGYMLSSRFFHRSEHGQTDGRVELRVPTHTHTHAHARGPGAWPRLGPSPPSAVCHGFYQTIDRGRVPRPAAAGFRPEAMTLPTPLPFGCFPFGQTSMLPPHDPHGLRPLSPCPRVPLRPRKAWTSSQASGLLLMYSSCPALIMGTNLDGMTFSVKSAS